MAQRPAAGGRGGGCAGPRVVGDYIFGRMIGRGSFSDVWLARHRVRGTEVAVKEIAMERLSKKLQESLRSEIVILKKIGHPNIIALYDIIEYPKTIYIVLEYCRGGDLSMYIQRHGRVPEATAKYFMQQLAVGLQVLREHNLIHRDLKPQNLLLSSNEDNCTLKIADFGFARPLQPRGLAETLCGSPLYMAPEIMQLQKYDAKADLWSVGVILFQLVTGKTPFTGNSQIELLQNVMRSNELHFPPGSNDLSRDCIDLCQKLLRRNPVERLTFDEFFNHHFLSESPPDERVRNSSTLSLTGDHCPLVECAQVSARNGSSQEECVPFQLDDETNGPEGNSIMLMRNSSMQCTSSRQERSRFVAARNSSMRSTYGFTVRGDIDKMPPCSPSNNMDALSRYSVHKPENTAGSTNFNTSLGGNLTEIKSPMGQSPVRFPSKDPVTTDSLELVDQDYVLVSGPPMEASSSSVSASQMCNSPCNSEVSHSASSRNCPSRPIKITGAAASKICATGSLESPSSLPSVASQGSTDMIDAMEQPSAHCLTRIRSLQQCASAISELVNEKILSGNLVEAFSIQLIVLAIWKQALYICHAQAASAIEGSPSLDIRDRGSMNKKDTPGSEDLGCTQPQDTHDISSQIERAFRLEVDHADELARNLRPVDETTEMPDAMEMVFQAALTLGRTGAVDELMGNMESAAMSYSKAVKLLQFLLVEAPSLILNPPFSLTNADRFRLRQYIDILGNRQSQSRYTG